MKALTYLLTVAVALGFAVAIVGCETKEVAEFACTEEGCDAVCETQEELDAHMAEAHPTEEPVVEEEDFVCEECEMLFLTEDEYVEHMKTVHPEEWAAMEAEAGGEEVVEEEAPAKETPAEEGGE
jgi:uncharacterized short protein YbdD (DUF466 family)